MALVLLPLVAGLVAMATVKRARVHGALLALWAVTTFFGFAPGGLLVSTVYLGQGNYIGGVLIFVASVSGFAASLIMLVRLRRLYRGDPLGSSTYLVRHHIAVVIAFSVADVLSLLMADEAFFFSLFCLVACAIGALITGYDQAKLPARPPQPVAF